MLRAWIYLWIVFHRLHAVLKRPVASPRKYNTFERLKMTSDVNVGSHVPRCENGKQQP